MNHRVVAILLAVVFFAALVNGYGLLFRLSYLLAMVLGLSALWAWANLRGIRVTIERRAEQSHVGHTFEEYLSIANESRIPKLWVELREQSDLPGHNAGGVFTLDSLQRRYWRVVTRCTQRGRFTLGPATLTTSDPFGLFRRTAVIEDRASLLVYPRVVELPHFALPAADLPGEGRLRRRTHDVTLNISGVRDYVSGDSLKRMHWPTTARTGRLMVKEFEQDPAADVWILLDMERAVQAGEGEESTEEYGVTIAASLARRYVQAHRSVGIVMVGAGRHVLLAERGGVHYNRILEALALVRARGTVPIGDLILMEARRFARHTALIVITPSTREEWVATLEAQSHRGVRTVAVHLEAETFGGQESSLLAISRLAAANIPAYLVKKGEPLERSLSVASSEMLAEALWQRRAHPGVPPRGT